MAIHDRAESLEDGTDLIDEAGFESFPASDPPCWTPTHAGSPCATADLERLEGGEEHVDPNGSKFAERLLALRGLARRHRPVALVLMGIGVAGGIAALSRRLASR